MITPAQGAERHQLVKWATPRLLRYFKSRRKSMIIYRQNFTLCGTSDCNCGYEFPPSARQTINAMEAELDYIQKILNSREHVK